MYTVLVISSHPDDMEIACAGTLLKCKERGDRVVVCHLSSGNQGHEVIMPEQLTEMRAREARKSGELAGFEVVWGGFNDLEIYDNNKESRDKVVRVIKQVNPDFIITHDPNDYMPDHVATSKLVFDACFTATLPHYDVGVAGSENVEFGNMYAREIESFSNSILNGTPLEVPASEGVYVQKIIEAAYASSESGNLIKV